MTESIEIGAWLPDDWGRTFDAEEEAQIRESNIDLLLVPENHDHWKRRDRWKRIARDLGVAIYVGLEDGPWVRGLFFDPVTDADFTYTKHSTAEKINLSREEWSPEEELKTTQFRGATVGTTICHDMYLSPFMGFEALSGASLLVNLSARPVVPKKWGEVLQARAIENGAYVVCTMHGTAPDGSTSKGSSAHVFAFDPFGEPIELQELETGDRRSIFETTPTNFYTFEMSSGKVEKARDTLECPGERPTITRIQDSTSESETVAEPRFSVQTSIDDIRIGYGEDDVHLNGFDSQAIELEDEGFYLVSVEGADILKPEQLYRDLLDQDDIGEKRLLIFNHWSELDPEYFEHVVEPVLRARCVEWASPAIAVSPDTTRAYQVWYAKNSSRMVPDESGRFQFYLYAARGVSSAFDPIQHEVKKMGTVASKCHSLRSG